MSRPDATWPAVYHMRMDLQKEKERLIQDLTEMSHHYWGGTDPFMDASLKQITWRIEELTAIINRINTGAYRL